MKQPIISKTQVRLYAAIAFAYACLWLFHNLNSFPGTFLQAVLNNIWRVIYVTAVNILLFEVSVPFVLRKRRYLVVNFFWGGLLLWGHVLLWSFGLYTWRLLGIGLGVYTPAPSFSTINKALEAQMAYSVGSVVFFGILRHVYRYQMLKQAAQQLRIEKQAAELHYLKSQTNPHFLFNTLNNIYSLAREKSSRAPEAILRLSKLLRYMLYEAGGDYVAIEQELKLIADYLELEKLRYDESLHIQYHYDVEDLRQSVPPLLLMPLVENAFKHGVSETRARPFVDIHLSLQKRQLRFIVKNSSEAPPAESGVKENIGLSNLRRQLTLLYRDFSLLTQQKEALFSAELTINLASHV